MSHTSVLRQEAVDALQIDPNGVYVDATLGRGGHSLLIAQQLQNGKLYCFDLDTTAIQESRIVLQEYLDKIEFIHSNFSEMKEVIPVEVNGILMDLGVSSPQFDDGDRGFSYRYDSRLDMRMNQQQELSAYEVVNTYSQEDLLRILYTYGEEKFAKNIVKNILANRPVETTFQLVDIIRDSIPNKVLRQSGHPAKKTFQALRIEVNKELESLEKGLDAAIELLKIGGKLVVITFHSLEDRLVKVKFNQLSKPEKGDRRMPILTESVVNYDHQLVKVTQQEIEDNNRAHSAKMRILTRKG